MLETLSKKQKIIFFTILSVMIVVIIYYIYTAIYSSDLYYLSENNDLTSSDLIENSSNADNNSNISDFEISSTDTIVVYICGAVKENKVVTLDENSRVCDAIDAAGGLTSEADLTNINLAYILEDGEKIYIPKKGEELQTDSVNSSNSQISQYSSSAVKTNKININKATQTELETIPGVGPSTALKIINYREENGKFTSIEDIKNVSGIGNAKYEKIKDYIVVK